MHKTIIHTYIRTYIGSNDDQIDDTPTGGYDDERPTSGYDDAPSHGDDEGPTSTYEDAPPPPTVDTTTEHSETESDQVRKCIVSYHYSVGTYVHTYVRTCSNSYYN